jgi:hypothetical protein
MYIKRDQMFHYKSKLFAVMLTMVSCVLSLFFMSAVTPVVNAIDLPCLG